MASVKLAHLTNVRQSGMCLNTNLINIHELSTKNRLTLLGSGSGRIFRWRRTLPAPWNRWSRTKCHCDYM